MRTRKEAAASVQAPASTPIPCQKCSRSLDAAPDIYARMLWSKRDIQFLTAFFNEAGHCFACGIEDAGGPVAVMTSRLGYGAREEMADDNDGNTEVEVLHVLPARNVAPLDGRRLEVHGVSVEK